MYSKQFLLRGKGVSVNFKVNIEQTKHSNSSTALLSASICPPSFCDSDQDGSQSVSVATKPVPIPATPGTLCTLSQASGRSGKARKGQGTKGQLLAEHWLYIEGSRA